MATKTVVIPSTCAALLPSKQSIAALKKTAAVDIPVNTTLYRAAWNSGSVLPTVATKFYRFGPPKSVVSVGQPPPYWWLYIADNIHTCIYEAQFCGNDERFPGRFYIKPYPEKNGLIASLKFPQDLRLLDLTGNTAFQMGIYDQLSRASHHWCKWFAHQLVSAGLFKGKNAFHGILYPSRRNRTHKAIALYSGFVDLGRPNIVVTTQDFKTTFEYQELKASKFRMKMPN